VLFSGTSLVFVAGINQKNC